MPPVMVVRADPAATVVTPLPDRVLAKVAALPNAGDQMAAKAAIGRAMTGVQLELIKKARAFGTDEFGRLDAIVESWIRQSQEDEQRASQHPVAAGDDHGSLAFRVSH